MTFVAAAIQLCSTVSPEKNAETLETLVREASSRGATYIQTPEMTGAVQKDRAGLRAVLRGEADDLIVAKACALARDLGIHLHIGSTAIALDDGMIANRGFLFSPAGSILARYDKIHMFDVDLDNGESWRESAVYRPGETAAVTDTSLAKIAMGICYDVRFPDLFTAQALAGAEILSAPAAFTRQTGEAHWHVLQRARAIENGAFMISAAQAGQHEDGRETYGHSIIIDPWGRILAEADGEGEAIVMAEIDTGAVKAARAKIPNLKNIRPFKLEPSAP
ncbi:carbon-nitrogen hydrolase family protein [Martelella alba]|uniref:Carbon-nitrogen hydrolase family protein n=1 Tax=Martelella alba TaxID=2590451 RepID=A0A506U9M2_9HYPH|nr:carbon-nitrogen hydrolase family protein [Martelella alba]TPW30056.1 carbon-nitrogen hydrolase family protein [Martelella alba]